MMAAPYIPTGLRSTARVAGLGMLAGILSVITADAEMRQFTSSDGIIVEAEPVSLNGEVVSLKLLEGKTVAVPLNRLSETDQEFIRQWHEEHKKKVPEHLKDKRPRVDITFNSGRSQRKADNLSGYVDERKQNFKPSVVLESRDAVYPIYHARLNILVSGKSMETGESVVVYKMAFEDIHLPLNEQIRFEADPFELWYDDRGAVYGFKFKGYCVWLEDPEGKVLAESHAPSTAAKYMENLQKLEAGDVFNRKFEKTGTKSLSKAVKM